MILEVQLGAVHQDSQIPEVLSWKNVSAVSNWEANEHAVADLVTGRRRKVLRGLRSLHDRSGVAADLTRVRYRIG
jgi:hypothetical protein